MEEKYIPLTPAQIAQLTSQGCRAQDWSGVQVGTGFDASKVCNVAFAGQVRLGSDVVVTNVRVRLADCVIHRGARVEDVSILECSGQSSFGIGVQVAAVNEGGGREVPLHPSMTAQTSYIIAMWRHRAAVIEKLLAIIEKERQAAVSDMCEIGEGAVVTSCGVLRDVRIGDHAVVTGAQRLENGTILSSKDAPAFVGYAVRARDFLFSRASRVESGSSLHRCFVGQGSLIEEGFTAVDSLFFVNCIMAEGEATSIFAGPYTVSHHKATLLIAGMFSFFNAGSGANQSNHLFKTGAVHQGINDRGCKYGSNAYVMLPARNGAFTTVLGSHTMHHDTSDFPYSYLMEQEEKSYLLPGAGLRSWGLVRDLEKWPARDRRPKEGAADLINFAPWNPYVTSKVARALSVCSGLLANAGPDTYTYERLKIKSVMLRRGKEIYRLAMDAALGEMFSAKPEKDLCPEGCGDWIDLGGMFAPKRVVYKLMEDIEQGIHLSMHTILRELGRIHASYPSYAYGWALSQLDPPAPSAESTEHPAECLPPASERVMAAIERGKQAMKTLQGYARDDASRDSDMVMATGYGIDSLNPEIREADFKAVRGVDIKK
ncbi:MAG: DUF4954 family protein [Rikenellaceae bacterium]|jgi:hypothetical protein|nr:DUF4954 family protein [Rikenellaceae bacterium]